MLITDNLTNIIWDLDVGQVKYMYIPANIKENYSFICPIIQSTDLGSIASIHDMNSDGFTLKVGNISPNAIRSTIIVDGMWFKVQ